ncbi:MAG: hypothetical protein IPK82_17620 [Polyangiaceae bacterium]|nr:hypothetical protein [Polyangiaceae bacterium]
MKCLPFASRLPLAALALAAVTGSLSCATGNGTTSGTAGNDTTSGTAGAGTAGTGGTGATGGGDPIGGFGGMGGKPDVPPVIYVHTNTALYQADPSKPDLAVTEIGPIDCIGGAGEDTSLTDLAVSADGQIWGISKTNVFRLEISGNTVLCTQTIPLNNPQDIRFYGLTFAPKGVLDPDKEVLIAGNTAGELWAVSESGQLTMHGTLGTVPATDGNGNTYPYAGKKWELSGDVVFLENGGAPAGFATVRDCPNPPSSSGCHSIDTLVELNITKLATAGSSSVLKSIRGQLVPSANCNDGTLGYGSIFGITAWKDKIFGFGRSQNLGGIAITINNDTAEGCILKTFTEEWSGAGVTTIADVDIPPPK